MSCDITVGITNQNPGQQQLYHWTECQFQPKLTSRSFIYCPKPSQTYLDVGSPRTFTELALIPHWSILRSRVNLAFNSTMVDTTPQSEDWAFHYRYHCSYERFLLSVAFSFFYQTPDKRELVSEEYWIHIDFARQHGRIAVVLLLPVAKFLRCICPFVFL